jgi:hypothetical protein
MICKRKAGRIVYAVEDIMGKKNPEFWHKPEFGTNRQEEISASGKFAEAVFEDRNSG